MRSHSLLFGALASRFFQPHACAATCLWIESAGFLKRYAENPGVPTVCWPECTPAMHFLLRISTEFSEKSVAKTTAHIDLLWRTSNSAIAEFELFTRHIGCSSVDET